jgi:hypothetical protein
LSLEFPPRIAEGSHLQVLGSLRLPVSEVVLKPEPGAKGGDSVLAASLLLVRLDAEDPLQVDVALPSRLRGRAGPQALVEAGFSIEIPLTQALAPAGAYQIYLVTGPHVAGPYPLTIAAP